MWTRIDFRLDWLQAYGLSFCCASVGLKGEPEFPFLIPDAAYVPMQNTFSAFSHVIKNYQSSGKMGKCRSRLICTHSSCSLAKNFNKEKNDNDIFILDWKSANTHTPDHKVVPRGNWWNLWRKICWIESANPEWKWVAHNTVAIL